MSGPLGGGPIGPRPGGGGGGGTTVDAGSADNIEWIGAAAIVDTNQPDAAQEFLGNLNRRIPADLDGRTTIQPYVAGTVPAGAGSVLICKYSLDNGSIWLDFTGVASVAIDALAAATSTTIGTARAIPEAARTDVLLTWFSDGDVVATDDPAYTVLGVLVR